MITNDSPRVRSLLRQAERNVDAGKLAAAEALYRQILDEAPQSTAAWLGLAAVAQNGPDQQAAYAQVLALDPDNAAARAALHGDPEPEVQVGPVDEGASPSADGKGGPVVETGAAAPMITAVAAPTDPDEVPERPYEVLEPDAQLYCYRHPNRGTSLRCYKCSKPICSECTVKTPVGYLCPDCYREAEDAFFNARPLDYVLATLVALPISLLAGYLVMTFSGGFFFIIILFFIGGAIGGVIGRVTKRVIGQRRGRYIPHLVAACVIIGVLVWALPVLLGALFVNPGALLALVGPGVYLATAVGSAFFWAR